MPSLEKHIEKVERILYEKRALDPSGTPDSEQPRGLLPDKKLARDALGYYKRGQELLRAAFSEMLRTPADSRVANMSTRAKLVPFGLEEDACGEDEDADERMRRFVVNERESAELSAAANADAAASLDDDQENED